MKKIHDFSAQAHSALAKLSAAAEARRSLIAFNQINLHAVIPAQPALERFHRGAGIQAVHRAAASTNPLATTHWIPAFAGMTGGWANP